jgi:hypothetical protein
MENMNLLDLDNDILNIIGDYVKKDNHDREFQEYMRMRKIETNSINLFNMPTVAEWSRRTYPAPFGGGRRGFDSPPTPTHKTCLLSAVGDLK